MDNDHGITGELRQYASYAATDRFRHSMLDIADRIDAEHEQAMAAAALIAGVPITDENMAEHGWVRLPKDADGKPTRVGDVMVMASHPFGCEDKPLVVDRMELSRGMHGEVWCLALDTDRSCWTQAAVLRHYHEPTVEDVLCELLDKVDDDRAGQAEIIAEYAKRLRLAGDAE